MPIELTSLIIRTENLVSSTIDTDLVILNLPCDHYIAFDAIGRRIWELIESPRRVEELCQQLHGEFNGAAEQITTDVVYFLNELENEKMLRIVDAQSE
ncbi:MAG: PqqD family protein [Candidatus Aminicenantes bacterium]|nr:PqqD family protein [Candidatus Aminicenantes bacterium]